MEYELLIQQMRALLAGVEDQVACLANASALLNAALPNINWVGFYLAKDGALWLGPFQGAPACVRIGAGEGVCGAAFAADQTFRVGDVHSFPGHIACDPASRSELVIPLHDAQGAPVAVLDIDSPVFGRFSEADEAGLSAIAKEIERAVWGNSVCM